MSELVRSNELGNNKKHKLVDVDRAAPILVDHAEEGLNLGWVQGVTHGREDLGHLRE